MNRHRLLIVEDEAIVAMDINDRLSGLGYQLVGHAINGEVALKLTRELRPDLVLMDIRLQGAMDGITAAEIIRRRFHVPVIFLTAYSEDETLERAKLAEPYGYILKPFDDRELKSAIEIALYKHRAEEEIRRLNRLYDVLSQVNQTVVRVQNREALLAELCELLVERGNVDLAWIGWLDAETNQLRPVAWAGKDQGMITQASFSAAGGPAGPGNPGQAARSGEPSVCNTCEPSRCLFPAAHSPACFGFQSCGSFPLRFQNRVCAVLSIYVAEPEFFGDREIELLKEVALDVSFALDKIEAEAQRLHLNAELQRQSAFLTTLLEALPSPVFYKDAQFRYLGCNPAYEQLLGLSRDQLIGKTAQELWPPDLAASYHRADQELLASTTTQLYESFLPAADGSLKDVIFHKAAYRNPDGGLGGIIGIVEDVTARQAAELALRESEARFRSMFELASVGMAQSDPRTGRFLRVNQKMCDITGYTADELLGMDFREITHPEDRSQDWQAFQQLVDGAAAAYRNEKRYIRKDGAIVWVNVNVTLHNDTAGQPLHSLAVIEDITARREAEAALRDSEEKFRLAMEAIQEGVWDLNVPTGDFYLTPGFLKSFGYDPEQVEYTLGYWEAVIHPEDYPSYHKLLEIHLAGAQPTFEAEFRARLGDGGFRWFTSQGRVVDRAPDGAPLRMVGALRDITGEKKARQALEESLSLHQATLESTADGIMVVDLNGQNISWNHKFIEMWSIPGELINSRDNRRIRAYAAAQLLDPQESLARSERDSANPAVESCDLLPLKDGRIFERFSKPQYLNGIIVGQVLSFRDVTARVKAEAALRQSEAGYRRIVETANEGIWAVDLRQCTTYVNQLMAEMLGYSREEMVGRPVTDFMFPEDLPDHHDVVNRRQRGKYERRLKRQDGSELWTIVSVRALTGEAGEFLGSFAMLTDITERKQAEEKLKDSNRRVRTKLASILAPEGDIGQLDLEDIIDVQAIQSLMDDFYQLTHLPLGLIDLQGKILVGVGWQEICTRFHRAHPESCRRCLESDTTLSQNISPGTFKLYKCKNNLRDMATPIMVGGKHIGNLFVGQFLLQDENLDHDIFLSQAREFGFDEEAYLAALARVPRLDRETVDTAIGFFAKLAHMISLLSLSNIKLARAVAEQERLVESLRLSEEKSRAGEEFLSDIFSSIRDGLNILDLNRTIIRVNPASEEFAQCDAMVGRKCHEVFHQRQDTCPGCPVEFTLETGKPNQAVIKVEGEGEGGNNRFVEIFSHPLVNRSTGQVQGVIEYAREVTARRRSEEALAASHRELQETARELVRSRNMLQLILESIPVRVFWKDKDLHYLGCNTLFARDAGFDHPQELLGQDDFAMGWWQQADLYRADDREVIESGRLKMNLVEPQTTPTGGAIWLKTSKVPLSGPNGGVFGVLGVYEDITELKEAEDRLKASLAEKEVMLKEIHHRVKNNLQMISTLFDLQLKYGGNQDPPTVFRDCQNRIRSMALVHESLYHTDTLASINFRRYLEKLINRLLASFGSKVQGIKAQVEGPEISLGINQAVPAGLVASEIIVNCLKHAFPEEQPGEIHISLEESNGRRVIEIRDNGVGLDREISLENPATFGWLMITNLIKQLEGTITVTSAAGTTCRMVF